MKNIYFFLFILAVFSLQSCAELQSIASQIPQENKVLTNQDIAQGLKAALKKGVDQEVKKLTLENGFYQNEAVKILLPKELTRVENTLRDIGLGNLADEGIKALNRAAEDAVKEATPIFVNAIAQMTISDAKNILMGDQNAATAYLKAKTNQELYKKFNPVIQNSFRKVGADQIWSNLITKYNQIPLTKNVNPDLTDYVTNQALEGVYFMIEQEEKQIRNKVSARTSQILQQVFALQDQF
ncbi:DUF4197 domain-containing protein [Mesonia sp. HuA40]|uniref:DUF4197 domain-containing protein n=1 Tax=Mesonia sp. HuA40 TaxID=2602761 RepID=UPI0011C75305|nr:DUF4197 domain-containing protein [Mesonia sp. HuA40]TXK73590.1 DUF4197 domain-containing protein [Mesonia sp. HuA40]